MRRGGWKMGLRTGRLLACCAVLAAASVAHGQLIISEVVDGTLSGGIPKVAEITNVGCDPIDLSGYSVGLFTNGSPTMGSNAIVLSGILPAGESFTIAYGGASGATAYVTVYGMSADLSSTSGGFNGDDVVVLFAGAGLSGDPGDGSGTPIEDKFGVVGEDGTGTAWDYVDSWARRNGNVLVGNGGAFSTAEWTFGGPDAMDGLTAAQIAAVTNAGTHTFDDPGCNPDPNACCDLLSGICTLELAADCNGPFDVFSPGVTDCGMVSCMVEAGACCDTTTGTCTEELAVDCVGGGLDYTAGMDCTMVSCVAATGACCVGGTCSTETELACQGLGGSYLGTGVLCDGDVDGDGVYAVCGDNCPTDPNKADPGLCGCLISDSEPNCGQCLIISEIVDATLPSGLPKFVEITNVCCDPVDMSKYSIGNINNGASTMGFNAGILSGFVAGQDSYVVSYDSGDSPGIGIFFDVYGFDPDDFSQGSFINGDDVIVLFFGAGLAGDPGDGSGTPVIDVYGIVGNIDPLSGWLYTDGYSYRNPNVVVGTAAFNLAEWTVGGVNSLEDPGGDDNIELALILANTNPGTHDFADQGCPAACCQAGVCSIEDEVTCTGLGGVFVGGACEGDVDADGVDGSCGDNCPLDPNKLDPGACGCGNPETDTDNDGTPDCVDGCPNDPNKTDPGICGCGVADTDSDTDGVADCNDNCVNDANPGQENSDGDTLGDACDNCPADDNQDQADGDTDDVGDVCDNCPQDANFDQADADADTLGDVCDNCPDDANFDQANTDGDLFGNVCDNCPNTSNNDQADSDADGVGNVCDNCPNTPNANQANADGDSAGDACDGCPNDPNKLAPGQCGCGVAETGDSDGDGIADCNDQCPGVDDGVFAPGCVGQIPAASEWGLAILALALLVVGKLSFHRRPETGTL